MAIRGFDKLNNWTESETMRRINKTRFCRNNTFFLKGVQQKEGLKLEEIPKLHFPLPSNWINFKLDVILFVGWSVGWLVGGWGGFYMSALVVLFDTEMDTFCKQL